MKTLLPQKELDQSNILVMYQIKTLRVTFELGKLTVLPFPVF
jgi:hypothetical protein